jgi:hypothetical protein
MSGNLMIKLREFKKKIASSRGDTIIEVILAIAALGTATSIAYVSTGHSLQLGTDAGNRNRAVGLAQQQVESIKNYLFLNGNAVLYKALGSTPFCVDSGGSPTIPIQSTGPNKNYCVVCTTSAGVTDTVQPYQNSAGKCPSGDTDIYALQVSYESLIFTIKAHWSGPNGSGVSEQVQYYKIPGVPGSEYPGFGGGGGGGATGPTSCNYDNSTSSVTQDPTDPTHYTAKVNLNPNCSPVAIINRSTFPGYPVITYISSGCPGPQNPPDSPRLSYNNDQVTYPGRQVNVFDYYRKNSGSCRVTFFWTGWDTRSPNKITTSITLTIP